MQLNTKSRLAFRFSLAILSSCDRYSHIFAHSFSREGVGISLLQEVHGVLDKGSLCRTCLVRRAIGKSTTKSMISHKTLDLSSSYTESSNPSSVCMLWHAFESSACRVSGWFLLHADMSDMILLLLSRVSSLKSRIMALRGNTNIHWSLVIYWTHFEIP